MVHQHIVRGKSTVLKISKAALLAAALSLSAMPGLSLAPALAEESASPATPELGFKLDIPTVVAVGSSMDESEIRDALSGNFLNHVDALAKLSATSITIPEITFTTTAAMEGASETSTATYKNLVLSDIKDGVAASVTMDSAASESAGATERCRSGMSVWTRARPRSSRPSSRGACSSSCAMAG